jgi:predicted nucleotidyltransferase
VADPLAERRDERTNLLAVARAYVDDLARRVPVLGAAVVGSVARGDFNVWSDIDVLVVVERLPDRLPERLELLCAGAPGRVQPAGFTPAELARARRRANPLVREMDEIGVVLRGEAALRGGP